MCPGQGNISRNIPFVISPTDPEWIASYTLHP
jgi:hypothetical protein